MTVLVPGEPKAFIIAVRSLATPAEARDFFESLPGSQEDLFLRHVEGRLLSDAFVRLLLSSTDYRHAIASNGSIPDARLRRLVHTLVPPGEHERVSLESLRSLLGVLKSIRQMKGLHAEVTTSCATAVFDARGSEESQRYAALWLAGDVFRLTPGDAARLFDRFDYDTLVRNALLRNPKTPPSVVDTIVAEERESHGEEPAPLRDILLDLCQHPHAAADAELRSDILAQARPAHLALLSQHADRETLKALTEYAFGQEPAYTIQYLRSAPVRVVHSLSPDRLEPLLRADDRELRLQAQGLLAQLRGRE